MTIVAAALALSCCEGPVERAEEQYELASTNYLDPGAKCAAARKVKEVALEQGDDDAYELWSLTEYSDCSEARRAYR